MEEMEKLVKQIEVNLDKFIGVSGKKTQKIEQHLSKPDKWYYKLFSNFKNVFSGSRGF